jgi:hypothetical protein
MSETGRNQRRPDPAPRSITPRRRGAVKQKAGPNVRIHVRGDGGFGNPTMYEVCERLAITYTFGLSTNAVLQRAGEELLAEAVRLWDETRAVRGAFWAALRLDDPNGPAMNNLRYPTAR